eukprot:gene5588-11271_t
MHCEIYPIEHIASTLCCEEEVRLEIDRYKGCLRSMFQQQNMTVLFAEVAIRLNSRPHAFIDAIPVPMVLLEEVKMFFKEEWSTHKKLILLSESKPLHRCIHPKFPFVSIEWDGGGGMAHVVEKERSFTTKFCTDIIKSVLEAEEEDNSDDNDNRISENESKRSAPRISSSWYSINMPLLFPWPALNNGVKKCQRSLSSQIENVAHKQNNNGPNETKTTCEGYQPTARLIQLQPTALLDTFLHKPQLPKYSVKWAHSSEADAYPIS